MATPSLFPIFLKAQVGDVFIVGSNVDATLVSSIGVGVVGEISVDQEGSPLAVIPFISVTVEGELSVELEVC